MSTTQSKRKRVVEVLRNTSGWVTASTIASRCGIGAKSTRECLHELAETDALEKRRVLTKRHTWEWRYVQLPEWFIDE